MDGIGDEVKAWVTYHDPIQNGTQIRLSTGHEIQYGGAAGDGFCYGHQSFSCVDNLTDEERQAARDALEGGTSVVSAMTLAREIYDVTPDYGSEGCSCGSHGTPARDCRVHWVIVVLERLGFSYTEVILAEPPKPA